MIPSNPVIPIVQRWNTLIEAAKGSATFGPVNPPVDIPNTSSGITGELAVLNANMNIQLEAHSNVVKSIKPTLKRVLGPSDGIGPFKAVQ